MIHVYTETDEALETVETYADDMEALSGTGLFHWLYQKVADALGMLLVCLVAN